jgi:uncharacterized protein (TIGR02001 family)
MTAVGTITAEWRPGLAVMSVLTLSLLCEPVHGQGIGGALGAASDDVFRGVSRSDSQPSLQADIHDAFDAGYIGISAESIRRGRDAHATPQVLLYASWQPLLTDAWAGTLQLRRYQYPNEAERAQFNYDEFALTLNWHARLTASVVLSPDTYVFAASEGQAKDGSGSAYDYALSWHQPLPAGFAAGAGVGYYDLRGAIGTGYAYWNASVTYGFRDFSLDLRYIGTDERARELFGARAGQRLVAAVLWSF